MGRLTVLVLLLAACGDSAGPGATRGPMEFDVRAIDIERVEARLQGGTISLKTQASDRYAWSNATGLHVHSADGIIYIRGDRNLDVTVVVPEGLDLIVVGRAAAVRVRGAWKNLELSTTAGKIDVEVERALGGTIRSTMAGVRFATRQAATLRDLTCNSIVGDVAVRVPASYRGRVYLNTKTGDLDVPEHPALRATVDASGKNVLAFVGEPFTEDDRKKELEEFGSPRTLFATSGSGKVTLTID